MDYLVSMTTNVPDETPLERLDEVRGREAERAQELAAAGHLHRLWRPPLQPGEWRTLGLFTATDENELEGVLESMPLHVWRTDTVTRLEPHPHDPAIDDVPLDPDRVEFLTTLVLEFPSEFSPDQARAAYDTARVRARELGDQGRLLRLWALPGAAHRTLGLWRVRNAAQLDELIVALPLIRWLTIRTVPLAKHPNDPALTSTPAPR